MNRILGLLVLSLVALALIWKFFWILGYYFNQYHGL